MYLKQAILRNSCCHSSFMSKCNHLCFSHGFSVPVFSWPIHYPLG